MSAPGTSHCFTVSPPKISGFLFVVVCFLLGGFWVLLCFLWMRFSSFDRSCVTATCCSLTFCHITTVSAVMARTAMVQKKLSCNGPALCLPQQNSRA